MSEQKPELSSAETGSAGTLAASEAALGPVQAAAEIESPGIAPNQEETSPKADALKVEAEVEPKIEPKVEPKAATAKAAAGSAKAPETTVAKAPAKPVQASKSVSKSPKPAKAAKGTTKKTKRK